MNRSLVHFGRAFGPPNIRHFSELAPDEQNALLARVPDLCPHYDGSVRVTDSGQLTALGLVRSSPAFDEFCGLLPAPG